MPRRALPLLLVLAACGTPQEQCINQATRDLRVIDRLIDEAEGNIQRGYAFEEVRVEGTRWVRCNPPPPPPPPPGPGPGPLPGGPGHAGPGNGGSQSTGPGLCLDDYSYTERRPVSINLAAEAEKLRGMKAKRAELVRGANAAITQCKAQYPE